MHSPLTYLISYVLFSYPLVGESVNDTSFVTSKENYVPFESNSMVPAVQENATASANTSVLSTAKQVETGELTTQKLKAIQKMNLIKGPKVKVVPTSNPESIVSTYRLNSDEDGTTCILMTVDALISFIYITKLEEKEESDTFVPDGDKVDLSGDCSNEDKSVMLLKWKSFALKFEFGKSPGGERWFISGVQLDFNTNESTFKHPKDDNTNIQAKTVGEVLFPTPVGQSFKCHREIVINLLDRLHPNFQVKLLLRELTVEPFIFKNNDFGPEYLCLAAGDGSFRSETAPFIFGSMLTIASLFTIAGYAIYRYLKVNKVQYDTME